VEIVVRAFRFGRPAIDRLGMGVLFLQIALHDSARLGLGHQLDDRLIGPGGPTFAEHVGAPALPAGAATLEPRLDVIGPRALELAEQHRKGIARDLGPRLHAHEHAVTIAVDQAAHAHRMANGG
jgi:hypothetical protein